MLKLLLCYTIQQVVTRKVQYMHKFLFYFFNLMLGPNYFKIYNHWKFSNLLIMCLYQNVNNLNEQ